MSMNPIYSVIILTGAVLCSVCMPASATFRAGAAKRIITPDPLLPVSGGIGTPNPSKESKGDLSVRALVVEQDEIRVALVSIDNLGWPKMWGDKTRALVSEIPAENILISATHTHSAPDAYCFPDLEGKHHADLEYLEWVCRQAADAIKEALAGLRPAVLKISVGEAKGKIAYNYYAPQLYDPRCSVLQALDAADEKTVIATLVNYAIHPEVIGSNKGIVSPDLCGPLYDRIEQKVGGTAIFMNGAQGGMVTADNRSPDGDREIWEECVRIGELLAEEALRIVEKAPVQKNPNVYCAARPLVLTVESPLMQMLLANSPLAGTTDTFDTVTTQLNLVNIGTAQLLTIPGEALPNIGYYLKRKMRTAHPFLLGLTNDAFGYMLTRYDFNSFERYDYISQTSLGEMAAETYIEKALELMTESPSPVQ